MEKYIEAFGKFYNKPVIDNNLVNFLLTNILYFMHISRYCMLRIAVCTLFVVLYLYIGF